MPTKKQFLKIMQTDFELFGGSRHDERRVQGSETMQESLNRHSSLADVSGCDEDNFLLKPKVSALIQSYPDKPDQTFAIGDQTTDGKIVDFTQASDGLWYALTDKPSEWHLNNGQEHGWNWLWLLEKVD